MTAHEAYESLKQHAREVAIIDSCSGLLGWDERTYMPRRGSQFRAEQLGYLAGLRHEKFTSPQFGELLATAESDGFQDQPESVEAVNLREWRREYDLATKLPKSLVEEITRETTIAQGVWVEARKKDDFQSFLPNLETVIGLTKQMADAYGWEGERYNALLDQYEPGAKTEEVAEVFTVLRKELVTLLGKIKDAPRKPNTKIVEQAFDVEKQRVFGEMVCRAIGFDFSAGRLDITTHPFCSGFGIGDTRITTRYNPNRLNDALFGTMHEAGHALYEMGIKKEDHFGTPMGESVSLGIHESQSRMWENQVGRSKEFWTYFFPMAQGIFRDALSDVALDDFYAAINDVRPSYIRVEADEATYNLHILLRFELERAMMRDEIATKDLAGEWRKRFEEYLGIPVDNDRQGVLQDVHWSAGLIGYFPTYSLGNLYAAQFFAKAEADLPNLKAGFAHGNFEHLLTWLRENIHVHGRRYRATELAQRVTGKELSPQPLIDSLNTKFGAIYGF